MSHINAFIESRIVSTLVKRKNLLLVDNLYLNTYSKYLVDITKVQKSMLIRGKLDDVATSSIAIAKYVLKYAEL